MFLLIYSSRGRRLDILMLMLTLKWKLSDISPTCIWTGFSLRVLAVTNKIKWVPSLKDLPWTSMQLWFSYWSCTGWSFCSLSLCHILTHTTVFLLHLPVFLEMCRNNFLHTSSRTNIYQLSLMRFMPILLNSQARSEWYMHFSWYIEIIK